MKIVNKNFLAILILLGVTSFSYAFANGDTGTGTSSSSLRSDDTGMRPIDPSPRSDDTGMRPIDPSPRSDDSGMEPSDPPPRSDDSGMKPSDPPPRSDDSGMKPSNPPPRSDDSGMKPSDPPPRSDDSGMKPSNPAPRSDDTGMKPVFNNTSQNNSQITLKGKIDGYKVKLSWNKYSGSEDLLGYRIIVSQPSGEQKTISVDASKNEIDNWDAKTGVNKYILFAVGESGDLAESNSIVLSMGPNGGYDFSNGNNSGSGASVRPEPPRSQSGGMMPPPPSTFSNSGSSRDYRQEVRNNRQEARDNRQDFRKENGVLEQYLSGYTQEVRKQILDLKKEYQDKVFEIVKSSSGALTDDQKAQIDNLNTEFISKVSPLVGDNEKVLEFLKLRYDVFKESQDLRDQNKEMRQEYRDNSSKSNSGTVNKDNRKNDEKGASLKDKYKKIFEKKYSDKIASLSSDKIKMLISKIEELVKTYRESSDLTDLQKAQKIAQLEALRDILDDQLTSTEDLINVDDLLNQ